MTAIEKQNLLKIRKKQFGDLPEEILLNISDSGEVVYTEQDGKKTYGLPKGVRDLYSPPLRIEMYFSPSLTQQQFHDEVSIKSILKKYNIAPNYIPEEVQIPMEYFRDVSMSPKDYTEMHNAIREADETFMELPAELRRAVGDDPRRLLELSQSDKGIEELKKLGFAKFLPTEEQAPLKKEPVPAAGEKS